MGQFNGLPQRVIDNLPTPKSISATTNATPIVLTTSTAHGLKTGDFFLVTGAQDPAANGVWEAGTITSTTVVLTGSVGTLVGGAQGSVINLSFGVTYPVPTDGEKPRAATFAPGYEALGDRTAYLMALLRRHFQLPPLDGEVQTRLMTGPAAKSDGFAAMFPFVAPPGGVYRIPLDNLPEGQVLKAVSVGISQVDPPVAHPNLPGSMPTLKVWRVSAFSKDQIGSTATDPSANVAAYDASHEFGVTGLTHTIAKASYAYHCEYTHESGSDAQDMRVFYVSAQCQVAEITPW